METKIKDLSDRQLERLHDAIEAELLARSQYERQFGKRPNVSRAVAR
jgi:ribosomal protein S13